MLSIAARGSASRALDYYQHLKADNQLEDYYSKELEGVYVGSGADRLGLAGEARREEFKQLAEGQTTSGAAQNAGAEDRRAGWDLTFSAPKSVSILWATADKNTRVAIEKAHDMAVQKSVSFLEQHALFTRRGSGIERDENRREKVGLVAAAYRHGTSREQDPQLHSHVFAFNVAPRADGTVGALDSRPLYQWRLAAGCSYQAELAEQMRELGYEVEADGKAFRVASVPKSLETEFSKRRLQIEQALNERGAHGAKAAEVAALNTRKAKKIVSRQQLFADWQSRAQERVPDWKPETIRETRETGTCYEIDAGELLLQLTRDKSTFSEPDLYAAAAIASETAGGGIHRLDHVVSQLKSNPELVALQARDGQRYTTREMLLLESKMVKWAIQLAHTGRGGVSHENIERAMQARPEISAEQVKMVQHITSPGQIKCVQGAAGTGKSFSLGCARDAWQAAGYRVRGASLSGKAAAELQGGSGIESTTLKRLEINLFGCRDDAGNFHDPTDKLTQKDILVIDEAGMVGSRQIARLVKEVERAGSKLVLVGDTYQLQAIDAGAAFRAIQERIGFAELSDVRRQYSLEDRLAVNLLREGRANDALENLSKRGRLHDYTALRDAKAAIGLAVAQDMHEGKRSLALTGTRAEARDINECARAAARELGLVRGEDMPVLARAGQRDFAAGDRLLFTRNNRDLDVKNGELATIKSIMVRDGRVHITAVMDRGGEREIDCSQYDHVEHGYCVTVHKSQGSTVDRAHVLAADNGMASKEWSYVAGSRHRESLHIHADRATLKELAPAWSKSRQKDVSLDYVLAQNHPAPTRDHSMEMAL